MPSLRHHWLNPGRGHLPYFFLFLNGTRDKIGSAPPAWNFIQRRATRLITFRIDQGLELRSLWTTNVRAQLSTFDRPINGHKKKYSRRDHKLVTQREHNSKPPNFFPPLTYDRIIVLRFILFLLYFIHFFSFAVRISQVLTQHLSFPMLRSKSIIFSFFLSFSPPPPSKYRCCNKRAISFSRDSLLRFLEKIRLERIAAEERR